MAQCIKWKTVEVCQDIWLSHGSAGAAHTLLDAVLLRALGLGFLSSGDTLNALVVVVFGRRAFACLLAFCIITTSISTCCLSMPPPATE